MLLYDLLPGGPGGASGGPVPEGQPTVPDDALVQDN